MKKVSNQPFLSFQRKRCSFGKIKMVIGFTPPLKRMNLKGLREMEKENKKFSAFPIFSLQDFVFFLVELFVDLLVSLLAN